MARRDPSAHGRAPPDLLGRAHECAAGIAEPRRHRRAGAAWDEAYAAFGLAGTSKEWPTPFGSAERPPGPRR